MMHRRFWLVRLFTTAVLIGATGTASAQFRIDAIRQFRMQHEKAILSQLVEWLHIPNVASDSANIRRNADFIMELMRKRSIQTRLLTVPGSPPAVYGELRVPGATKTVMLYVHYDGQPVNPAQWDSDPWQPVFRDRLPLQGGRTMSLDELPDPVPGELRVYARSASDDKSPLIALLAAIDALKTNRIPITVNLKFFLEGEEEAGSPHMRAFLEKYSDLLHADVWLLCDGPVHQTGKKLVYFGARGITGVDITTYGAARPLHSGHYGNWAPNPISQLVHLLASLRDIDGRVLIDGYMDDVRPLTETEKQAIAAAPNLEQHLKDELALAWTEGRGRRLEELILRPAVNFKGFVSGQVGEKARNAIQTEARASVGFRLVPNQTPEKVRERVEAHIRKLGFHIVHEPPDLETRRKYPKLVYLHWEKGYPPARTSLDLPVSKAVIRILEEARGEPIVVLPSTGGSIPMYLFQEVLHSEVILVPMVNHDNNQHAENENLRIQNLWDGIEMYAALMARLGQLWP
ncbi:MAG: M20/M25/M40 family metallo-hydrolase [candidate division KSB1 bacterium]|nr:M20/M25/M40 family metallo-hydrolase [candidate division KSB1 bacterium]